LLVSVSCSDVYMSKVVWNVFLSTLWALFGRKNIMYKHTYLPAQLPVSLYVLLCVLLCLLAPFVARLFACFLLACSMLLCPSIARCMLTVVYFMLYLLCAPCR
ncbi:hypothetical protein V8C86DRAFT_2476729, partial [Haematococcus lacustris]